MLDLIEAQLQCSATRYVKEDASDNPEFRKSNKRIRKHGAMRLFVIGSGKVELCLGVESSRKRMPSGTADHQWGQYM
jgi:hypothetical protein